MYKSISLQILHDKKRKNLESDQDTGINCPKKLLNLNTNSRKFSTVKTVCNPSLVNYFQSGGLGVWVGGCKNMNRRKCTFGMKDYTGKKKRKKN